MQLVYLPLSDPVKFLLDFKDFGLHRGKLHLTLFGDTHGYWLLPIKDTILYRDENDLVPCCNRLKFGLKLTVGMNTDREVILVFEEKF